MVPIETVTAHSTYLRLLEWLSSLFLSTSLISFYFCIPYHVVKIEDDFSWSGKSMDFGIRQIYLNANLFSFQCLTLVRLFLLHQTSASVCIIGLLEGLNERKTFTYNHLAPRKYSIKVLSPPPLLLSSTELYVKKYSKYLPNWGCFYQLSLNPG